VLKRQEIAGEFGVTESDLEIAPPGLSPGAVANVHDLDRLTDQVVVNRVHVGVAAVMEPPHYIGLRGEPGSDRAALRQTV
jgi:hypothetical protein